MAAADGVAVAVAGGVAVAGPALPALGATTPGIGAAGGCAAADPAPVPAEAGAGARSGEPSPGMVACPPCAAAVGVEAGCALPGRAAVGCGWVDAGDAAGAGVADACADWGCTDGVIGSAPSNRYRL